MSAVSLIRGNLRQETKKSKAKKKKGGQRKKEPRQRQIEKDCGGKGEQSIFKVGRTIKHISTLNWPKHPH